VRAPVATSPGDAPAADLMLLAVGVLAASSSGPLIAATAAPALAIAFWRNGLGAAAVGAYAALWARSDFVRMPPGALRMAVVAGALLAAHFGTFVPSLHLTSVASSAALVCSQVVWAALLGRVLGERLGRRALVGTALSLVAVLLVTGVDVSLSTRALTGDLLALLGGLFGGGYIVAGGVVRRSLSTAAYTTVCYSTCAALLLVVCVAGGVSLGGYAAEDWARIFALTVLAQLLGHSVFNLVLRSISPTLVSLSTLFTVPLAAVLAAALLGQTPPIETVPALVLLLVGTGMVISARDRQAEPVPAAD
jgi:drug/metabolite transporter (DMT)-like permease